MIDIAQAIRFEESTHTYWLDGKRVPSITQAMRPATDGQFDFVDKEVLRRKADQGTMLHKMVELSFEGEARVWDFVEDNPGAADLLPDLDAYMRFQQDTGFSVLRMEDIVASRLYGFAGRLDLYGMLSGDQPGTTSIIDIKRTSSPPRSAGLQLAAQEIGLRETLGLPDTYIINRFVLHLKNGKYKLIPHTDPQDRLTFLAALRVTHWREQK